MLIVLLLMLNFFFSLRTKTKKKWRKVSIFEAFGMMNISKGCNLWFLIEQQENTKKKTWSLVKRRLVTYLNVILSHISMFLLISIYICNPQEWKSFLVCLIIFLKALFFFCCSCAIFNCLLFVFDHKRR